MHALDTTAARMDALTDAIRRLVPVLVEIRKRHGAHVTRLALEAALEECRLEVQRQHRARRPLGLASRATAPEDT